MIAMTMITTRAVRRVVQAELVPRIAATERQLGGISRRVAYASLCEQVRVGSVWVPWSRGGAGVEAGVDLVQESRGRDMVQGETLRSTCCDGCSIRIS